MRTLGMLTTAAVALSTLIAALRLFDDAPPSQLGDAWALALALGWLSSRVEIHGLRAYE